MGRRFCFFIYLFAILFSNAQTLTQRLKKKTVGEGDVIIYQSASLKNILDGWPLNNEVVSESQKNKKSESSTKNNANPKPMTSERTENKESAILGQSNRQILYGGKKLTTNRKIVPGYRVQIFIGGNSRNDRQKAYAAGYKFKSLYIDMPVYTHFSSPHWSCVVGNFQTMQEALDLKKELIENGTFPTATVIKTKIKI